MKTALITGITGQDGAYLSKYLLEKDYTIIGITRNQSSLSRLKYLGMENKITFQVCNLLDFSQISKLIKYYEPDEIYNLAAQSSVSQSFRQPLETMNFNILSVLNILEAIKNINNRIKFYQASSSEMYGLVRDLPITVQTPMHPVSPYGISKASAHWITSNYRESYGIFACCGILFNHESYLRDPNYFIKKVIRNAIQIKNNERDVLIVGNIDIKRDFGYSPFYVEAMWKMLQQNEPDNYIVCSGKSVLLREIVYFVFNLLDIDKDKIVIDKALFRPCEIPDIYGDNSMTKLMLDWHYEHDFFDILKILIREELENIRPK
ncbi:MAG: GDP-mannose 4,6-dehydratase [Methanoregulaceae archaeon]|jgi:GDPmannose 4,6-dehydratase